MDASGDPGKLPDREVFQAPLALGACVEEQLRGEDVRELL